MRSIQKEKRILVIAFNTLKFRFFTVYFMDLNEILTRERDSLRDENIELRKKVKELEAKIEELNK
jgi:hypothetical protein